jgi:hypothetical protein
MATSFDLSDDLEKKLNRLVENGDYNSKSELLRSAIRDKVRGELPTQEERTYTGNTNDGGIFWVQDDQTYLADVTFAEMPILDSRFTYSIKPNTRSNYLEFSEFEGVLGYMAEELGARLSEASFTISQQGGMWYGESASTFLEAVSDPSSRYKSIPDDVELHHTETFNLIFRSDLGIINLSGSISVDSGNNKKEPRNIGDVVIGVLTDEVPMDTTDLRQFEEVTEFQTSDLNLHLGKEINEALKANDLLPEKENLSSPANDFSRRTGANLEMDVEAKNRIVHTSASGDYRLVESIVIDNPFFQNEELYEEKLDNWWFDDLTKVKEMVAHIHHSAHPVDENPEYILDSIQLANTEGWGRGSQLNIEAKVRPKR